MAVASAEFLARGYEGASMGRIARAAGISPKTVYARYANKDELLLAVVDDLTAGFRHDAIHELSKPSIHLEHTLTTFASAFARGWTSENEVGLYRLIISEATRFPHLAVLYRRSVEELRTMLVHYLAAQAGRGTLLIDDAAKSAMQFHALVTSELRERMLLGEQPLPEEVKDTVACAVKLFLNGYRPRSSPGA